MGIEFMTWSMLFRNIFLIFVKGDSASSECLQILLEEKFVMMLGREQVGGRSADSSTEF